MNIKRISSLILWCAGLSLTASAQTASGSCGDNATWTLDGGTLTISGTGATTDFISPTSSYATYPEWTDYKDQITAVVVNEGITSLGSFSFYGYSGITSVTLPNGLTRIGNYTFYGCSFQSINLPYTLEYIGDKLQSYSNNGYTFAKCDLLRSITLPEGLKLIAGGAFDNCTSLTTLNWESTSCDVNVFDPVNRYVGVFVGSGIGTVNFGSKVKSIPAYTFKNVSNLINLNTPGTISFVGYEAFAGTGWISDHTVADGITYIDHVAYKFTQADVIYTDSLDIKFATSTQCITDYAFSGATRIKSITIPPTVSKIGNNAFDGCTGLRSVLWEAVEISADDSDYSAKSLFTPSHNVALTQFMFGDYVKSLPDYLLHNCSGLEYVALPESLISIGENVFTGCDGFTSLTIPDNVETLGRLAIYGCANLETVTIGTGVKDFDYYYFLGQCPKLTSLLWMPVHPTEKALDLYHTTDACAAPIEKLYIGGTVKYFPGQLFLNSTTLSEVEIYGNLENIGEGAFRNCSALKSIELPSSLQTISAYAFYDTPLQSIIVPMNVTEIGTWALGNSSLSTLICCPLDPPSNTSSLISHSSDLCIYVPDKDRYNTNGWEQYYPMVESMTEVDTHELATPTARPTFNCLIPGYTIKSVSYSKLVAEPGEYSVELPATFTGENGDFEALIPYTYAYTGQSAITDIAADTSAPCDYYTLQGVKIYSGTTGTQPSLPAGVYIRRTADGAAKIRIN